MEPGLNKFDQELIPYLSRYPLISNQPNEDPDGNPVLYGGFYCAVRSTYFPQDEHIQKYVRDLYDDCRIVPGLISRGSHKRLDEQEHDDYIGLTFAAMVSGNRDIALDVYVYGKNHGWVFDSQHTAHGWIKSRRFWHQRFPGQIAHYKICAGIRLNILDRLWMIVGFLFPSKSESGVQLEWLRACAYAISSDKGFFRSLAVKWWMLAVLDRYPNGMGGVFHKYFDRGGSVPKHIFARWMQGRI